MTALVVYLLLGGVALLLMGVVGILYVIAPLLPLLDDPHGKIVASRDARGGTDGR